MLCASFVAGRPFCTLYCTLYFTLRTGERGQRERQQRGVAGAVQQRQQRLQAARRQQPRGAFLATRPRAQPRAVSRA